jgi:DNA invertase Pin-like site-specific DNA recombinase
MAKTTKPTKTGSGTRTALYLRVSTGKQTTKNQERELRQVADRHGWSIDKRHVYRDHGISGAKDQRPGLKALLEAVTRREFDRVAVWSTDRLGRSMPRLVRVLEQLKAKGIELYDFKNGIDTSTPMGEGFYYLSGIFAQIERNMIVDRIRAGLARARAEGTMLGRPKIRPEVEAQIRQHLAEGKLGIHKIARLVVNPATKKPIGSGTVQRVRAMTLTTDGGAA